MLKRFASELCGYLEHEFQKSSGLLWTAIWEIESVAQSAEALMHFSFDPLPWKSGLP